MITIVYYRDIGIYTNHKKSKSLLEITPPAEIGPTSLYKMVTVY